MIKLNLISSEDALKAMEKILKTADELRELLEEHGLEWDGEHIGTSKQGVLNTDIINMADTSLISQSFLNYIRINHEKALREILADLAERTFKPVQVTWNCEFGSVTINLNEVQGAIPDAGSFNDNKED